MKKIIKKTIAGVILTLMVLIGGLITLVFSPQILFAKKMEYKNFSVYYDNEIDHEAAHKILDDAYALVQRSELHAADVHFDIFLAHNNIFNDIESLQGIGPIARATAGNITFKVPLDLKNGRALGTRSEVNLTNLLAHEMVHVLQAHRYGLINYSPIKHPPLWKLEGYPEYVSRSNARRSSDYNLVNEIDRYVMLEKSSGDGFVEVVKNHFVPAYYYKGRLMTEYLIEVQGFSYYKIVHDPRSEEEVFSEMLNWRNLQ